MLPGFSTRPIIGILDQMHLPPVISSFEGNLGDRLAHYQVMKAKLKILAEPTALLLAFCDCYSVIYLLQNSVYFFDLRMTSVVGHKHMYPVINLYPAATRIFS